MSMVKLASCFVLGCLAIDAVIATEYFNTRLLHNDAFIERVFKKFVSEHQKPYSDSQDEYENRKQIFRKNLYKIYSMNESDRGSAEYVINEFSDMTYAEFSKLKLGYKDLDGGPSSQEGFINFDKLWNELLKEEGQTEKELLESLPVSFDWRKHQDVVTGVKNQGHCGSCWSFGTTGSIEGQYKINRNISVSLSEQELIDCDKVDEGCNGGLPTIAYSQIMNLGGLETEKAYPYQGSVVDGCKIKKTSVKYNIDGFTSLPSADEDKMRIWLVKRGPISIGINAIAMQSYKRGISAPNQHYCAKGKDTLDHAVLIVGYGQEKSTPYWIIKNSWGTSWGELGYYRVYRGDNTCGLALDPSTAILNRSSK